ncbi:MAG: sulfurtransferase TusA family protein [Thiotrichales bacterium]
MTTQATQTLDTRGMNCPLPILKTKKALNTMLSGDTLEIQATDPGSVKDIRSFCEQTGNELMSSNDEGGVFSFLIRKA